MRGLSWSLLSCVVGCSGAVPAEEATSSNVGRSEAELVSNNRIAMNRIATNRIALNRIALNRIALNRIALNKIATNRIALNRIALNRIALNRLQLDGSADELLSTDGGRELLRYTAECALPEGTTLVGKYAGTEYEFPGAIGLAPAWVRRALDRADQRWISACLLARVNAHDVSVQISLRGPHRALTTSDAEQATFSLEEGAFWGNIFTDEGRDGLYHACQGADQAAGETGDLVNRDCTEPDPAHRGMTQCGFAYEGLCGGDGRHDTCRGYDAEGMYYRHCESSGRAPRYHEVITTFVQP